MVGELPDPARAAGLGFAAAGDAIALVTAPGWAPSEAASELAKLRGEPVAGPLPEADPEALRALHATIREAVRAGALRSAHDVAEGGVAVALAECCLARGLGARVGLAGVALFAEGPGAFVVSGERAALEALGPAARVVGTVGGDALEIADELSVALDDLDRVHSTGLAEALV
jgi:phosphoribosylformylglycinamidine synthase